MTVFVLGGAQSDFARNFAKEGRGILNLFAEVVPAAPEDVGVAHVGNLAAELFTGQAQLGGLLVAAVPALDGVPSTRHEAACASGSTAVLAACADIEAGRYDVALVVGVELMRNVDGQRAAEHLGSAAWAGHEAVGAKFPWPALFAEVAATYDERYGLDPEHLGQFAAHAFDRAARNPLAQARDWRFPAGAFGPDDELNPVIEGRLRKQDCGRITDGAAAVVLASPAFAGRLGGGFPRIAGFGHRTSHIGLAEKLSAEGEYLFPHLRGAVVDAYERAGVPGPDALDVVELHDCFTITGLVALEHLGAAPPGDGGRFVADGGLDAAGINPGGGLIGLGHPVGATGVRMLHDVSRQVTGKAGETQVEGARTALTLNVGGSFTTVVTMVVTA
ncbi:acetyl-CoA acetyltransferase [Amycolatopsis sp. SID8362]|uniref:acetyl-CoA acetyltransferase n=1 Tax=Amycolatopsis sp. SID8362 TaxID=2690346 RepID=UPI00136A55B3|nr:acetyl-CoA acetyltransferase [Amycolatopsis sp. SID8362]NBH08056.1 thiolase domain-containing protein [Amycolatopsis sp. SID8362]NED44750.1 thiolase domain-containing protein [Amycolatopsis sp. SID8362]